MAFLLKMHGLRNSFFVAAMLLMCLRSVALAQPVITSGPNYCCWSIGQIQQALTATGGNGTYAWSLVGGSLPPGISIRTDVPSSFPVGASAGLIGVATAAGNYNFTLQVASNGRSVTQSASVHISALILKDLGQFLDAFAYVPYQAYQLTALNNAGPVAYKVNSGSLPAGMSLSASGVFSGTPTTPGNYSWSVQFTDGVDTEYRGFNISVYAIDITTPGQLPNAIQNGAYSVAITASGGAGGYTFTSGGLPGGLTLSSSGVISGTVTAGPGRWAFSLTATDVKGASYSKEMSLEVAGGAPFPAIVLSGNGTWDDCTIGVSCGRNGYASGGAAPYNWSAVGLPPGMSIRFGSGITSSSIIPGDFELWGSPTALGTYTVQLTVTDSMGAATTSTLPLRVSSLIADFSTNLPKGTIGMSYSDKFRVLGGAAQYGVSQTGGALADGLSLDAASLTVSGTPLENGSFFATFQFADTASHTLQVTNYYTIGGGSSTIAIGTSYNLGSWTVGSAPKIYLYACCASSYVWTVIGGAAPPGLSLSTSGVLSGTATTAGIYTFLVSAADASNTSNAGIRQFVMNVTPIALTTATTLPYGNAGAPYSQLLTATGGVGSLTWALAPFSYLPSGLSLTSAGSVSGTPTQTGQFQFTIIVADQGGNSGAWTFTIFVYPAAATRYVAPNGNDANPGSITQPYLTVQKCASAVYGGSTCLIRAGTYRETVGPNSGITIMAYSGESVTIDGTDPVANWNVYQGSTYATNVILSADDTNQVFVAAQMMTEARWPNGDDLFHVNWAYTQSGTNDSQLVDRSLPNVDWTGAKVHLLGGSDPWSPQTATVTSSSAGQLKISLDDQDFSPYIQPQAGGFYYLYRSLAALDKQGEWFYDSTQHILYFWAPGDVNPNTLNVRAKRRRYAFDLSGSSHVTIQNINLFGCGIYMSASSANNILDGLNAQYLSQFSDLPNPSGADPTYYWTDHAMDSGIVLNGSGNILRNSSIGWSAGNGVSLLGSGNMVINNLIYNTGYAGNTTGGIFMAGANETVQYNTIHTSGRLALAIWPGYPSSGNSDVSYNNFFNSMLLSLDFGEIYATTANFAGTRIHHNWLHDTQTPIPFVGNYPRVGVYLDVDASGFEVDQNVLWNNEYFNIHLNGSGAGVTTVNPFNNYVHNNSIPDVALYGYIRVENVGNCGTTLIQDNLVFEPVTEFSTYPACTALNNNSGAAGATEMTSNVRVGCSFAGCASGGPPAISGISVGASIAVQPLSAVVPVGQTARFTVGAAGSPAIRYQWQRDGTDIPGATSASYTTRATTFADNGAVFTVAVGNSIGTAMSDPATLQVGSTPVLAPAISAVTNAESGSPTIAPNTWVAIYGSGLAPVGDSRIWQGSDFVADQMPVQLDGVSVKTNGENAFVYYISPNQLNVLTPPDIPPGPVQVTVTAGGMASAAYTATAQQLSPSFFVFDGTHVAAAHADGSLVGPATLYPGLTTPAAPGETILLYANGFGPVSPPVAAGSDVQLGTLPALPVIQIGGLPASVQFAGLVSPGLFQFNVVVPAAATSGDNALTAQYNGVSTQTGVLLTVQ